MSRLTDPSCWEEWGMQKFGILEGFGRDLKDHLTPPPRICWALLTHKLLLWKLNSYQKIVRELSYSRQENYIFKYYLNLNETNVMEMDPSLQSDWIKHAQQSSWQSQHLQPCHRQDSRGHPQLKINRENQEFLNTPRSEALLNKHTFTSTFSSPSTTSSEFLPVVKYLLPGIPLRSLGLV